MFEKLVVNYAPRFAAWILIVLGFCLLSTCLTGCSSYYDDVQGRRIQALREEVQELRGNDNSRFYEVSFFINGKWVPVFSGVYENIKVFSYIYSENKTSFTIKTVPDEWNISIPAFEGFEKIKIVRHYRFTGGNETKIINLKDEKK